MPFHMRPSTLITIRSTIILSIFILIFLNTCSLARVAAQDYVIYYDGPFDILHSNGATTGEGSGRLEWRLRLSSPSAKAGDTINVYIDYQAEWHYSNTGGNGKPYNFSYFPVSIRVVVNTGGLTAKPLETNVDFILDMLGADRTWTALPFDFSGSRTVPVHFKIPSEAKEGTYQFQASMPDLASLVSQTSEGQFYRVGTTNPVSLQVAGTGATKTPTAPQPASPPSSNPSSPSSGQPTQAGGVVGWAGQHPIAATVIGGVVVVVFAGGILILGGAAIGGITIGESATAVGTIVLGGITAVGSMASEAAGAGLIYVECAATDAAEIGAGIVSDATLSVAKGAAIVGGVATGAAELGSSLAGEASDAAFPGGISLKHIVKHALLHLTIHGLDMAAPDVLSSAPIPNPMPDAHVTWQENIVRGAGE